MTDITEVKVINRSHHPLPQYATPLSAGMAFVPTSTPPSPFAPLSATSYPQVFS